MASYFKSCSSSQRSVSIAAMQPDPAAVIACRYVKSWTSPQANTPSTFVFEESCSVTVYKLLSCEKHFIAIEMQICVIKCK